MLPIEEAKLDLLSSPNSRAFFKRVWAQKEGVYRARIERLGFVELEHVLDAGAGFGQWSLELSKANGRVTAVEYDEERLAILKEIANSQQCNNLECKGGSLAEVEFEGGSFDGIFCYSVLYLTDWITVLERFCHWLSDGGLLYFNPNALGWYLHNLVNRHNDSADFDSREMAINALKASLEFYSSGEFNGEGQLIMEKSVVLRELRRIGFVDITMGGDCQLGANTEVSAKSFYPTSHFGVDSNYEVFYRRPGRTR